MLNGDPMYLRMGQSQRMGSTFLSASIVLGLLVLLAMCFPRGFLCLQPAGLQRRYSLVFLMMGTVLLIT